MPLEEDPLQSLKLPLLASQRKGCDAGVTPSTAASLHRRTTASPGSSLRSTASTTSTVSWQEGGTAVGLREPEPAASRKEPRGPGGLATLFNLTGAILGAGILSMPYAFKIAGLATILVVVALGAMTAYTAVLIPRCLERAMKVVPAHERRGEPLDWPLIGYAALGSAGRRLVNAVFLAELFFILMAFLVVNGSNAQLLLPDASRSTLIGASGAFSCVLLFVPFRVFSYFFLVGHVALGTTVASMVVSGLHLPELPDSSDYELVRWQGLPQTVGIILFCNVAHGTIPSIYMPCGCKRHFSQVTQVSFAMVAALYFMTGASGYLFFGSAAQQNIVSNLGRDLSHAPIAGLEFLPVLASAGFVVKLQTSFPLYATPIVSAAEALLGLSSGSVFSLPRVLVRAGVMTGCSALAIVLKDHMANCIALTGSLLSMCTAIIFPTTFYFLLFRRELSWIDVLLLAGICAIGIYFQATGTRDSLVQILGIGGDVAP